MLFFTRRIAARESVGSGERREKSCSPSSASGCLTKASTASSTFTPSSTICALANFNKFSTECIGWSGQRTPTTKENADSVRNLTWRDTV